MLTHTLKYIYKQLLTCSFKDINTVCKNLSCINEDLINYIYIKKYFFNIWNNKFSLRPSKNKFKYTYTILQEDKKYLKIKFNILHSFIIKNKAQYINSASNNEFIIFLSNLNSKFNLKFIIFKEDNPELYYSALNNIFILPDDLSFSKEINFWLDKIANIESIYNKFCKSFSIKTNKVRSSNKFNIENACIYAEQYALNPNPNYKDFSENGGDCTNFVSQIIHAGGIKYSTSWTPYSNAWLRVEELFSYLTSKGIGYKLDKNASLSRGNLIQFYTPSIGRYFHSGFITYELENNDYLYCCHTYNKLNYPLSAIYPIIYPTLRAIEF